MDIQVHPHVKTALTPSALRSGLFGPARRRRRAWRLLQASVYEALAERGIEPDWIAGMSIGAINAAIIAGNAPNDRIDRLRESGIW